MEENRENLFEFLKLHKTKIGLVFIFVLLVVVGIWTYNTYWKKNNLKQPLAEVDQPVSAMTGEVVKFSKDQLELKNDGDGQNYSFALTGNIPISRLSSYVQDFEKADKKSITTGAKLNVIYRKDSDQIKVVSVVLMPKFSAIGVVKKNEGQEMVVGVNDQEIKIVTDEKTNIIGYNDNKVREEKMSVDKIKINDQVAIAGEKEADGVVVATKIEIILNNNQEIKS